MVALGKDPAPYTGILKVANRQLANATYSPAGTRSDWKCNSLKVYFTLERNLSFSVCKKKTDSQRATLNNQEILSTDRNLNVQLALQLMCSKNLYLVITSPTKSVCKHLDVTKNQLLKAITIYQDPNEDNCWMAQVDMKQLHCKKFVVPPFRLDMDDALIPYINVNKDLVHLADTKAKALCTLCLHILYNVSWKNDRPGYFLKYLKNTKELLVMLPLNKHATVGRALSIIHRRQNENGTWKVHNWWLYERQGGVSIGPETKIDEDMLGLYDGALDL
jgi:hypothetical protein